jgi:hypothetical protein
VHPGTLTTSQASEWARDELERITRHHLYQHLTPGAYQINRCTAVMRVWKAGLIRQVDKWIEWQRAAEIQRPSPRDPSHPPQGAGSTTRRVQRRVVRNGPGGGLRVQIGGMPKK